MITWRARAHNLRVRTINRIPDKPPQVRNTPEPWRN